MDTYQDELHLLLQLLPPPFPKLLHNAPASYGGRLERVENVPLYRRIIENEPVLTGMNSRYCLPHFPKFSTTRRPSLNGYLPRIPPVRLLYPPRFPKFSKAMVNHRGFWRIKNASLWCLNRHNYHRKHMGLTTEMADNLVTADAKSKSWTPISMSRSSRIM